MTPITMVRNVAELTRIISPAPHDIRSIFGALLFSPDPDDCEAVELRDQVMESIVNYCGMSPGMSEPEIKQALVGKPFWTGVTPLDDLLDEMAHSIRGWLGEQEH